VPVVEVNKCEEEITRLIVHS
jgi:hypothetical protein